MKQTLKYLSLIVVFIIIGFLSEDYFLKFSLWQLPQENHQIVHRSLSRQYDALKVFALSIGMIPLLYLIVKKSTKLKFRNQGLISCGIIIGCGILLWQFRIFQLSRRIQMLPKFKHSEDVQNLISFESLNFESYLSIGFMIGTVLRNCPKITCPFLLVLLLANCVENTRHSYRYACVFRLVGQQNNCL